MAPASQSKRPRVGIIALQHEANSFIPTQVTLQDFQLDGLHRGEDIRHRYIDAHYEIGGFFQGLDEAGVEAVPIFAARAVPGGIVPRALYQLLLNDLLQELARAGQVEGLLLAPHGAAVSEDERDMDGHWMSVVRQQVGPDIPIVCTLDLHANLSKRMTGACNAIIGYRTNPHLDQRERGREAAALLARTIAGELHPTMAVQFPPIAINIERQLTAEPPCSTLFSLADHQIAQDSRVLSNTVLLGFPYADVVEMGASCVVVTDNDQHLADLLAKQLSSHLIANRHDFVGHLIKPKDAIAQAAQTAGTVCLLDMGDNVGGGSAGDGTVLAAALRQHPIGPAAICLYDPDAVIAAERAGEGSTTTLAMGAKSDRMHGETLVAEVQVISFHDGKFQEDSPRHGGRTAYDMGKSAVVRAGGLTIVLNSRRTPPFSPGQLTSCGLDPSQFKVIVAKGVHAPVAAYQAVCSKFIRVNTPGVTTADMSKLTYHHRRQPLYPFEEI